jgi:hypothetical protein
MLKEMMTDGYPFRVRRFISQARDNNLSENYNLFLESQSLNNTVLLSGYPKSGNTLFRFVYFNLLNQIEPFYEGDISFDVLNEVQLHTVESSETSKPTYEAYPLFIRTHLNYLDPFSNLNLVYVYRNPLDCMVSMYYFKEKYRTWRKEKKSFKNSLRVYFPEWCYHLKSYESKADIFLSYESMYRHPFEAFKDAFLKLGLEFSDEQLKTAIQLSSFKNVRAIEEKFGSGTMTSAKKHGSEYGGLFTRSGKIGQWKEYYDEEDLEYVRKNLRRFNLKKSYNFIFS